MNTSKGIVLFARNNEKIDYLKQAYFLAKKARILLNLPTTVVTDSRLYLLEKYPDAEEVFDNIISVVWKDKNQNEQTVLSKNENHSLKTYRDGTLSKSKLKFKNTLRSSVYDITPYYETLVLDTDILLTDDTYSFCFDQCEDFLIYDKSYDLANFRDTSEFVFVSDAGIKFYWATVVFFRKTYINKLFFDLLQHIEDNWYHYKSIFQINQSYFRNDYAFSIAIHIMNGYNQGSFAKSMPGKLYHTTDKDICWDIENDRIVFLLEKEKYVGEYTALSWKGTSIHIMNKFSYNRCIDKVIHNV